MKINKIKKTGFTLAEVLITLGIIGVVAALTIPTLLANNQKTQFVTGIKEFYSFFNNGMKQYMLNQGCSDLTCTELFNGISTDAAFTTKNNADLPTIFKGASIYGTNSTAMQNFYQTDINNTTRNNDFFDGYAFQLANGMIISFNDSNSGNCTLWSAAAATAKLRNACSEVFVDVNGKKGPNLRGKDGYHFFLGNDGVLYPNTGRDHDVVVPGAHWTYWPARCGTSGSTDLSAIQGSGCAARIMEEGWEITYF